MALGLPNISRSTYWYFIFTIFLPFSMGIIFGTQHYFVLMTGCLSFGLGASLGLLFAKLKLHLKLNKTTPPVDSTALISATATPQKLLSDYTMQSVDV